MPRLTQAVPRYRKHKSSGQAIVEINGNRHYLGRHASKASRLEYDRLVTEWLASGRSASYGVPARQLSVAEMLVAYLDFARRYYGNGPRTELSQMVRTVRPLQRLYGRQLACEFDGQKLKTVRQQFISAGGCRSYVNLSVQRLVRVFPWAAGEAMIPATVPTALSMVAGLRRGKSEAPEGRKVLPVEADAVAATLPFVPSVVRAMIELQQLCGARPGEICVLRPMDVDRSSDVWEFKLDEHKTAHCGKERTVYLGPLAQEVLRPFLLRPADAFCFSPAESIAEIRAARTAARKTPLSCGNSVGSKRLRRKPRCQPGGRYTTQSYGRAIQRACDLAFPVPSDIEADSKAAKAWRDDHRWSPNRLRHSLATKVRREFDLDTASVMLGHSQIAVTQRYAEQDHAKAVAAARKIG